MENCGHDVSYRQSPHHLIYKEELKKDGEKEVVCSYWQCKEPIWGSLHNCVECGNLPVHNYSSSNNHCLDFTEKLENEVVCSGCHEPVLGSAYKCCVSKCTILIHKTCAELPPKINHPLHPDHTLYIRWRRNERCDACCQSHNTSFFYFCDLCDFQLDIKCSNRLPTNPNDCHPHELFPISKRIHYNCEACGEELIMNLAYRECNICKLLVHKRCAEIPRTVKIVLHNHFLSLIYSLHEISKRDNMFCRICADNVNREYAAYYCQECGYILHTECLRRFRHRYKELGPNKSIGHAIELSRHSTKQMTKDLTLGKSNILVINNIS